MGRLFDGVAALCGLSSVTSSRDRRRWPWNLPPRKSSAAKPIRSVCPATTPAIADWEPMLRAILADRAAGVPIARVSARFHNALAELAAGVAGNGEAT